MTDNEKMKFSIVICTYNRDQFLERTLESLNDLDYNNFEVIVVNGPSTDNTSLILEKYIDRIKIYNNPLANLSISRNLGIRASQGDVVAFIDDDAIPQPNWLHQIKEIYDLNEIVGGVGGRVYGPGGDHFQFHNGIINIWGEADAKREEPGPFISPKSKNYNILMGVNSTFLKSAMINIGGFDEYYEYYHDESDVCVRLTKAGYPIFHHQEAYVHHEFAKSHIRSSTYKLNWYPIVKNTVYFGIKNSRGIENIFNRVFTPFWVANKRLNEFKHWLRNGDITKEDYRSFKKMWLKGVLRGYWDGFTTNRRINNDLKQKGEFKKFNKKKSADSSIQYVNNDIYEKYGICLLSKSYPPYGNGGVGTYTKVLAEGLVKRGYPVYVITSGLPSYKLILNGVHLISADKIDSDQGFEFIPETMNVSKTNLEYSMRVSYIVESLMNEGKIKVLETPLWDYEGLVSTRIRSLKTVLRLETPLKVAAEMQRWGWNNDFQLSSLLEKELINSCNAVITISNDIKETISRNYNLDWSDKDINLIPLGIEKNSLSNDEIISNSHSDNQITVLFIGRLERRKGVDILLEAAKSICLKYLNVRFILAGDDKIPFKDGKTISDLFIKNNPLIADRIIFKGEVSEDEKRKLLISCDIFVAPSRYESFGLVFLEAMQFSKPVVGTNIGGIKEIVNSDDVGILVEVEDASMLKESLIALIESPNLRLTIGNNGFERFNQNFTSDIMVDKTIKLYDKVIYK